MWRIWLVVTPISGGSLELKIEAALALHAEVCAEASLARMARAGHPGVEAAVAAPRSCRYVCF